MEAKIKFYARFVEATEQGKRTPKYVLTDFAGSYPEFKSLIGKDGRISLNLLASMDSGHTAENAPAMRLQGTKSYPFTGIKDLFKGGKMTGYSYGYAPEAPTYGTRTPRPNPFYNVCKDGYLFVWAASSVGKDWAHVPEGFELLVIDSGKTMAAAHAKVLTQGGFDEQLKQLRLQAKPYNVPQAEG